MTEKDKMLAGMIYDANHDNDLNRERMNAKTLCHEFNGIPPAETDRQRKTLMRLLGKTSGGNFTILPSFWCDYGYNIEIGANFFANHNTVILDAARVKFGDNVFIAPNCGFYTAGHPMDVERRNKGLEYAYPITVGDNVWIGGNVTVCPGVTIGSNCVIGAGAVVTRDIPDNSLAVGVPAKVVRKIENAPQESREEIS